MRVTRGRAGAALSAVVAAGCAVAVSGCGSSTVSNIIDPVAKAATVSNAAAGYQMKFSMNFSSPALGGAPLGATGSGSFETASRTGEMNLSMNLGSQAASLLGSNSFDLQELMNGTTFYIKFPAALSAQIPGGKPWVSLNLATLGQEAGIPGISSLLSNPTSSNPAAILQFLKAASGGITKVGTVTVNGQQTTEYKATIDLAKYPDLVPSSQKATAQAAIAAMEKSTGLTSLPVTVYVDNNHLVRRMQFSFTEKVPGTSQSLTGAMTLDITSYGDQPTPSFPPASEVIPLSSLLGG